MKTKVNYKEQYLNEWLVVATKLFNNHINEFMKLKESQYDERRYKKSLKMKTKVEYSEDFFIDL